MRFSLEVGTVEKHCLELFFSQLRGRLEVLVDGQPVAARRWTFSEPVSDLLAFEAGGQERLSIRIEKKRNHLIGSRFRVFLNDRLIRFCEGC